MTPLGREPCPHSTGTSWGCVAAPAPCSYPCSYPRCRCATWHRHLACSSDAGGRFGQSSSRIRARGKNGLRVRLASRGGWEHVGRPQLATADVAPRAGPHFWSPLPKNGAAAAPARGQHRAVASISGVLGRTGRREGKESARRWSSMGCLRARCQQRGETPREVLRQGTATAGSQAGAAGGWADGRMDGRMAAATGSARTAWQGQG